MSVLAGSRNDAEFDARFAMDLVRSFTTRQPVSLDCNTPDVPNTLHAASFHVRNARCEREGGAKQSVVTQLPPLNHILN